MRISPGFWTSLLLGVAITTGSNPAASAATLDDTLAELHYRIGKEASEVPDFQLKERIYLDSRHLIVPGANSRAYLVTLHANCHGLRSNRVIPWTHTRHRLARGDVLAPSHQGRRVDECRVERIQELESD